MELNEITATWRASTAVNFPAHGHDASSGTQPMTEHEDLGSLLFMVAAVIAFMLLGLSNASSQESLCLRLDRSSSLNDFWINQCNVYVGVKWTSEKPCGGWSCGGQIKPYGKSTISKNRGRVQWRECRGKHCQASANSTGSDGKSSGKDGKSSAPTRQADGNFSGRWYGSVGWGVFKAGLTLDISVNGNSATGVASSRNDPDIRFSGTISGNRLSYTYNQPIGGEPVQVTLTKKNDNTISYAGNGSGVTMSGTMRKQ